MNQDNNIESNSNQKLRLKRNKPFNFTKNTLEKCMLINSEDKSENNSYSQSSISSSP